jgi:hypothetical protein
VIHSKRGALQGLALSVALVAGILGSIVAVSSPALASTTAGTKTKTTTYSLSCQTGIANGDVSVKTTQTYPSSVAPGAKFKITWSSVTTVEGALASAAYTLAPGGKEDGTVVTDDDNSSDATPATNNIAGKKGIAESGTISSPSSFNIDTPTSGTITTPAFTAGTAGTESITAGTDDANITIYNKQGKEVTTTTADCSPAGTPATIAKIKVT